ncbi:MAG TPA: PPOX class F420-dependent oxidoreductase [Actinomycetota bacterium]|nr:PPOX class F420-dependent oxidoreductase [Actinomycetota bacterium]
MKQAVRQPRPRDHAQATAPAFPGKYLSLTSFRRDGTGVATPVWFVEADGRLLVETDADSYKVRRIRRNPQVTIAPCTATGRLRGTPVPARVTLLPDTELARVDRLMGDKYRVDLYVIKPLRTLQAALHRRRPRGTPVVLEITPL